LEIILVRDRFAGAKRRHHRHAPPYHLQNTEAWVFADSFVERLRFEVDKQWQGELPRTYLFSDDGEAEAVSGKLNEVQLMR
jgi:hypothetical protein